MCDSPPTIANGSPGTPTSTEPGGTVIYTCNTGYQISDGVTTETLTCMTDLSWGTLPVCQRTYSYCSIYKQCTNMFEYALHV